MLVVLVQCMLSMAMKRLGIASVVQRASVLIPVANTRVAAEVHCHSFMHAGAALKLCFHNDTWKTSHPLGGSSQIPRSPIMRSGL